MIDLDAIKARLAKATPGTWRVLYATSGNRRFAYLVESGEVCIAHLNLRTDEAKAIDDADFIAHAPADVAALVAEAERLREEIAHPVECPACGSCGETGCCKTPMCRYLVQHQGDYDALVAENVALRAEVAALRGTSP